jgi:hypothetical protein
LPIDELHDLPKTLFESSVDSIRKKTQGKLIIKEYPTASAHAGHFRGLMKELKIKRQFTPKIIFIDYLNICASSRFKSGSNVGSYFYIKAIAEELRGFAVENNLPIVSATQVNRSGFTASDFGLEDTSESFFLPSTADFMFALIQTEELEGLNQILVKQLKNRYNDPTKNKKFILGIDRPKMNFLFLVGSLYLFLSCFTNIWLSPSNSSVCMSANIKSAVDGNPKLSLVSSNPKSDAVNPLLFT